MNKWLLKPEFINAQVITKSESGQDVLIDKTNFSDYWAERMLVNGQGHLIQLSANYKPDMEKKSFLHITENVIISTFGKEQTEKSEQKEIAEPQELKRKRGRQPKQKA